MKSPNLKRIKVQALLQIVSEYFGVPIKEITGKKRTKDIANIRMIAMYLARECLSLSFPIIGKSIGKRDHTTVMHAHKQVTQKMEKDVKLKNDIIQLTSLLLDFAEKKSLTSVDTGSDIRKMAKKYQKPETDPLKIEINKLLSKKISIQKPKRQKEIFKMWTDGDSLEDISRHYKLSRQRINQIVNQAILLEAQKLVKEGFVLDIKEFVKSKKKQHTKKLGLKKGYGVKKEVVKKVKIKKWSRYYDKCRMCDSINNKHHSHGYCKKCYTKSDVWKESVKKSHLKHRDKILKRQRAYAKEYNKRPEIIEKRKIEYDFKKYGGNREKALKRDAYTCKKCGLTQENSLKKYGKDLFVMHINSKNDHSLPNLITLCNGCFTLEKFHNS